MADPVIAAIYVAAGAVSTLLIQKGDEKDDGRLQWTGAIIGALTFLSAVQRSTSYALLSIIEIGIGIAIGMLIYKRKLK